MQVYLRPQGQRLQRSVGVLNHAFTRLQHTTETSHEFGRVANGRQRSTIGTSQVHLWHGVVSAW